jgi:hypothetical protein
MDYNVVTTVGAPGAVKWDMIVVAPPHDGSPMIIATAPSPANFTASTAPGGSNMQVVDVYGARVTASMICRDYITNAPTIATVVRLPAHLPRGVRHTYKSVTCDMTASTLNDGGSIIAAQIPVTSTTCASSFSADTLSGAPTVGSAVLAEVDFEIPGDDITLSRMTASTVYSAPAKDGFYMPMKLDTATCVNFDAGALAAGRILVDAQATPHLYWLGRGDNINDYLSTYVTMSTTGTTGRTRPWWANDVNSRTQLRNYPGLSCAADSTTGVAIVRGLDANATLTLTLRLGLECTLYPESPLVSQVSPPVRVDAAALSAYYDIARVMKDAYPARDNIFGLAIPAVINALRAAWPVVRAVAPKLISAASAAAPVVKEIIETVRGESAPASKAKRRKRGKASAPAAVVETFRPGKSALALALGARSKSRSVSRRRASSVASRRSRRT